MPGRYGYIEVDWSHLERPNPNHPLLKKLVKWAETHPKSREQTKALAALVSTELHRNIQAKEGKNVNGLEDSSDRLSYKEGGLMYLVGKLRWGQEACESCQKGNGPFKVCVVVPGFFEGCCASCRYKEHQNRCSFEKSVKWEEKAYELQMMQFLKEAKVDKWEDRRSG